jgi:hypothetical protein
VFYEVFVPEPWDGFVPDPWDSLLTPGYMKPSQGSGTDSQEHFRQFSLSEIKNFKATEISKMAAPPRPPCPSPKLPLHHGVPRNYGNRIFLFLKKKNLKI